jgi:hypothetical protein
MAVSARRTHALQEKGLITIQEKVQAGLMEDPQLYGYQDHYNLICCWGSPGLGVLLRKPFLDDTVVDERTSLHPKLSQVLRVRDDSILEPPLCANFELDFRKYLYLKRTLDKKLWLPPNTVAISSRKSLAEMLTSGYVMKLLDRDGIIPVVASPNPKHKDQTIKVAFGPLLDKNRNACKPGGRYRASTIYNSLRMKHSVDYHDAWLSHIWLADSHCSMRYLNGGAPVGTRCV